MKAVSSGSCVDNDVEIEIHTCVRVFHTGGYL